MRNSHCGGGRTPGTVTGLLVMLVLISSIADEEPVPAPLTSLELTEIDGKRHVPLQDPETRAVVLIFVSTDCPIANAFQPWLDRIDHACRNRGVRSFQVHATVRADRTRIRQHRQDFAIRMPVVIDAEQILARHVAARVTPEAIVIDRDGVIRYRGLINDLYAGYGKKRRTPTTHCLMDALDDVLASRPVRVPETRPIGCFIQYSSAEKTSCHTQNHQSSFLATTANAYDKACRN